MKTYKIRKFQNGKNKQGQPFINYSLTIPSAVAEALPEDMQFACELTEDGILFKPTAVESEVVSLPSWANKGRSSNGGSAEPTPAKKASSGRTRRARPGRKAAAKS
jgi:hypothetical protein